MWQLARWHGQPAMGGATSLCIASVSQGIVDMAARSRMSREVHVRSLWGTGGEIPPVYPALGGAKGKGTSGGPARPKVPKRRAGADCSVVAMKRVTTAERRGQAIRVVIDLVNRRREEPTDHDRGRQLSLDGTSRVTGDSHARFCERLGVKFPGPTRRLSTDRATDRLGFRDSHEQGCGATR